jgi:hypothetical protein
MSEWENYTDTDGASLPKFFRNWIIWHCGQDVMSLIDRAGVFHDWLTYKYPNTEKHNRKSFIKLLNRYKIDKKLVWSINFGLWIYDISPDSLKKLLKRTTV